MHLHKPESSVVARCRIGQCKTSPGIPVSHNELADPTPTTKDTRLHSMCSCTTSRRIDHIVESVNFAAENVAQQIDSDDL